MDKCIYYHNMDELSFNSREHIFPNALGGMQRLPKGYVSDQFNNYISKYERLLFKEKTIINFLRALEGSNKKNDKIIQEMSSIKHLTKKELKNSTRSAIHIVNETNKLGFLVSNKAYYIWNVTFSNLSSESKNPSISFSISPFDFENIEIEFINFIELSTKAIKNKFIRYVKNENLKDDTCIFSYDSIEKNIYYSANKNFKIDLNKFIPYLNQLKITEKYKSSITQKPSFSMALELDFNLIVKIFLKITFNLLAFKLGKEFILESQFNHIRNLIVSQNLEDCKTIRFSLVEEPLIKMPQTHSVIIRSSDKNIIVVFSLFHKFNFKINLMDDYLGQKLNIFYILDYKNHIEYFDFQEFIMKNIENLNY